MKSVCPPEMSASDQDVMFRVPGGCMVHFIGFFGCLVGCNPSCEQSGSFRYIFDIRKPAYEVQEMKLRHHIILHSVIWLLFMGIPVASSLLSYQGSPSLTAYLIIFSIINVSCFYSSYFYSSAFVLDKGRPLSLLWMLVLIILIFTGLRMLGEEVIIRFFPEDEDMGKEWYISVLVNLVNVLIYSVIALLLAFFTSWVKTRQQKDTLDKERQQAELALLRSQINPHFLFNTLNNLYSLVYRKSDDAPGALMKLSEIMRYMLYEANAEKVLLEKEIVYIRSYIELQQLRLSQPDFIELKVTGNPGGRMIPPMLLITFVENAFKHGNKSVSSPGIVINIQNHPEEFVFEISSYLVEGIMQQKDPHHGIGLQNVKRRLELTYPDRHDLLIGLSKEKFYVKLRIDGT